MYYQPDVFLVCGMPHNGKTWFSIGYGQEKSNTIVFHVDTVFFFLIDKFPEEDNIKDLFDIYSFINHKSFDKEVFLHHLRNSLDSVCRQNCYKKTIIIEGYICGVLFNEIKQLINEEFHLKNIYRIDMIKTYEGYEVHFDNILMGISTKLDYFPIIQKIDNYLITLKKTEQKSSYQKFSWITENETNSNSNIKLAASFGTDNIFGKTFLDIGCNSGFFSFTARQMGAKKVVGIDTGENWIEHAYDINKYFYNMGDIQFINQSFAEYESLHAFDIVFCASVFHYFKAQQFDVLKKIYNMLEPNGLLYLEIELSPKSDIDVEWTIRGNDAEPLAYPTKNGFIQMINGLYNIEKEQPSYKQPGCLYDRVFYKLRKC